MASAVTSPFETRSLSSGIGIEWSFVAQQPWSVCDLIGKLSLSLCCLYCIFPSATFCLLLWHVRAQLILLVCSSQTCHATSRGSISWIVTVFDDFDRFGDSHRVWTAVLTCDVDCRLSNLSVTTYSLCASVIFQTEASSTDTPSPATRSMELHITLQI